MFHILDLAIFSFHGKLYLNTCSVELPAGDYGMNNVILTKLCIGININIGVLKNR